MSNPIESKPVASSPGPWAVEHPYDEPGVYVSGPNTELIAKFYGDNAEANARAVAALPKLLENLKMMTDLAERYGVGNDCDGNIIEAREVIALAEGGAS